MHKERINYVKCEHPDGRVSYTGMSVNFGNCVTSSWESPEDLKEAMKGMLQCYLKFSQDMLDNGLEMVEVTHDEWEALDDNIDYWEIERMKRILKRPSIQAMLLPELAEKLGDEVYAIHAIGAIINTQAHQKESK